MPKSLVLLQESDYGYLNIGTIDHSNGDVNITNRVASDISERSSSKNYMVVGENTVGVWSESRQLVIRDFDGDVVYNCDTLMQFVNGSRPYVSFPFSSKPEWDSYGDIYYASITRDWFTYNLFIVDATGSEITETEITYDYTSLPDFIEAKILYRPGFIYAIGVTTGAVFKIFRQAVGEPTWTELYSMQAVHQSGFTHYWLHPTKQEEYFYFSSTQTTKHMHRVKLNVDTGVVTFNENFAQDVFPTVGSAFNSATESACIETGKLGIEYWQGGSLYTGYSFGGANVTVVDNAGKEANTKAGFFQRHNTLAMYCDSVVFSANSYSGHTKRFRFKPDLTERGILFHLESGPLVIDVDGSIKKYNSVEFAAAALQAQTAAGFVVGDQWNEMTVAFLPNANKLVLANDSGSGPVIHVMNVSCGGAPIFGAYYGGAAWHFKSWHGYFDGFASYEGTWQNLDYLGKTLFDATPTIDSWDEITHLAIVNRAQSGYSLGEFIRTQDDSFGYDFFHALIQGYDNTVNKVDHLRAIDLVFPNGDSNDYNGESSGGVFDIPGTDYVIQVTKCSITTIDRTTGDLTHRFVQDNDDNREFGYDYGQVVLPLPTERKIVGTVKHKDTGVGIPDIKLYLMGQNGLKKLAETISDVNGNYEFPVYSTRGKMVIAERGNGDYRMTNLLVPINV